MVEIIAFTRALPHSRKHRIPAMRLRNVVDQFHDHDGLADTGATERADLATFDERTDEVDDLDAGFEDVGARFLLNEGGRRPVDRIFLVEFYRALLIDGDARDVEDSPKHALAHRHGNR